MVKVCFVSVDVENDLNKDTFKSIEAMDKLILLFRKYHIKATFFVTGQILEKFPYNVKEWAREHEIACHGYYHVPLHTLSVVERKAQLEQFSKLYFKLFKKKPLGFRAVQHTIDETQLELLEQCNYRYDSSVIPRYIPLRTYIGYKGKAPLKPYFPDKQNIRKIGQLKLGQSQDCSKVLEIPVVPLLGGISLYGTWIRFFGPTFFKTLITLRKPNYLALAMHPWDAFLYEGEYSKNSGEHFLNYLDTLLENLSRYYTFKSYEEVATSDKIGL